MKKKINNIVKEAVDLNTVRQAIRNKKYVELYYDDKNPSEEGNPRGKRIIMPLDVGTSEAGNLVLRAYQVNGNSRTGAPDYIYPRLDRVEKWKEMKKTFNAPPDNRYNFHGDRSMNHVDTQANFNLPTQGDVDVARLKDAANAPKVSTKNAQGPISANQQWKKNVFTSQPNSKRYAQFARNVDKTGEKTDEYWDDYERALQQANAQNQAPRPPQTQSGPVDNSYDEDFYDVNDVDFNENNFIKNKNRR